MARIGFDFKAFRSFLFFIIFVALIGGGVYTVMKFPQFRSKASKSTRTSAIQVINITEESATIAWHTDDPNTGFLSYGSTIELGRTRLDNRDVATGQPGLYYNHMVTLTGLSPKTKYYYTIGVKDQTIDRDGSPFVFFTSGATRGVPLQSNITSRIVSNGLPAADYLLTISFENRRTNSLSNTIGTITLENGQFVLELNKLRTADGTAVFAFDPNDTYAVNVVMTDNLGTVVAQSLSYSPRSTFPVLTFAKPNSDLLLPQETTTPLVTPTPSVLRLVTPNPQSNTLIGPTTIVTPRPIVTPQPTTRSSLRLLL